MQSQSVHTSCTAAEAVLHATPSLADLSARALQQLQALLDIAQRHSAGKRPDGKSLWHVSRWLQKTAYANIGNGQAPRFLLTKHYGAWLIDHQRALGLRKLELDNPYKAPPGAILVLRPGTRHFPTGDIAVVGRGGHFYNGGERDYGGPLYFPRGNKHVVGIFVPT